MNELFNMFYVDGDLIQTLFKFLLLVLVLDFSMSFAAAIKSVKSAVS